jgi:hypothetical protein
MGHVQKMGGLAVPLEVSETLNALGRLPTSGGGHRRPLSINPVSSRWSEMCLLKQLVKDEQHGFESRWGRHFLQ